MPFVANAQTNEEEKQDQPSSSQGPIAPVGGSGAVRLSPTGGVPAAGGSGTSSSTTGANPPAPQGAGGQFASLNQYLTANQGQAAPIAGKLTSSINDQYNTLNNQNTATLGGINNQVAAGSAPTQDQTNATIAQESANPVSFASNPGNVTSFQNLLNASYGGPASAEGTTDYTNQQNAINSAISAGQNAVGTEAGREGLLSQNEATPTTGVTALNSAILSQDPNALNSIESAYQPFGGLLTTLQSGADTTDKQIAAQQATANQDVQSANAAITGQTQGLNTAVNSQLANANTANTNFVNNYNGIISNLGYGNSLTSDQVAQLGMTPEQYAALQAQTNLAGTSQYMTGHNFGAPSATTNINNAQFLAQEAAPAAVTANQVATPQQFQTLMALLSLNNGQLPNGAVLDPNAVAQAGTYATPTLNGAFNYNQALQNATTTEQQERADAQTQATALTAAADLAHAQSQHGGGLLGGITQAVTHPIDTIASVSNPISWAPNLINMAKGSGPTPLNVNPTKPTTANPLTNSVNNLPAQIGAAAVTNPTMLLGAAHGGIIPEKKDIFKTLVNNLPTGVR